MSSLTILRCVVSCRCVVSSAVLDFLWACLQAPSLWQGKVKKEALIDSSLSMVSFIPYIVADGT